MTVDVAGEFAVRVAAAVEAAFGVQLGPEGALVRPAAPGHGADLQANVAMGLARRLESPFRVAQRIVAALDADDLVDAIRVDEPGFIKRAGPYGPAGPGGHRDRDR